ncbi:hypothetical protein B0H14DRAFT_3537880 [Mycena olivaceomarginata]|nr:hypothetical protein B0H14DRAFT_3537880 [Mycena olivaceomarginata]
MAETDLSGTSDDEKPLTAAQKARDTRARSRIEEDAAARRLVADTVWDTSRKRTVSDAEPVDPQKSKKTKVAQRSDDDDMEVDVVPARKPPARRAPNLKSDPAKPKANAVKSKSKSETVSPTASPKRKYLSRVVVDSDAEEEEAAAEEQVNKGPGRSSAKVSKAAGGIPAIPSKSKQKPTKVASDDDGSETDNSGSQSDDEEMEDQQSGDEGPVDLDAEVHVQPLFVTILNLTPFI